MKKPYRYALFVVITWVLLPFAALSTDMQSARLLGLAGAGHAAPGLFDAVYYNPAHLSYGVMQAVNANIGYDSFKNAAPTFFNATIADGFDQSFFQAALAYVRYPKQNIIHASLAKSFFKKKASLGVTAKLLWQEQESLRTALGNIFTNPRLSTDLLVGLNVKPSEKLHFGLTIDNFLGAAATQLGVPPTITLGSSFVLGKKLAFYVDPSYVLKGPFAWSNFGASAAFEVAIMQDLAVRAGYLYQSYMPSQFLRGDGFSLGISFNVSKVSFDAGLLTSLKNLKESVFQFGAGVFY
jgi:hypothetical protein